jgi:hypothetical protein
MQGLEVFNSGQTCTKKGYFSPNPKRFMKKIQAIKVFSYGQAHATKKHTKKTCDQVAQDNHNNYSCEEHQRPKTLHWQFMHNISHSSWPPKGIPMLQQPTFFKKTCQELHTINEAPYCKILQSASL